MSILKSLAFAAMPPNVSNPIVNRRMKLITRLEEQKSLAQDPTHIRTTQKWVRSNGDKRLVERQQKVRPWWRTDVTGSVVLSVRYGLKPVEFEKGKGAVVVPSKDKLVSVIDTVIAAVRAGELDEILAQQTRARGVPKAKRAA